MCMCGCVVGSVGVTFRSERNNPSTQVHSPILGAHVAICVSVYSFCPKHLYSFVSTALRFEDFSSGRKFRNALF